MLLPALSLPPSDERLTTPNSGRLCRKLSLSSAVAVASVSVATAAATAQRTLEIVIAVLPGVPKEIDTAITIASTSMYCYEAGATRHIRTQQARADDVSRIGRD